jgi:hypothetical protein
MFCTTYSLQSIGALVILHQGLLVLKNFNIEDEAGGVNMPIIKNFRAEVLDNTLEMQFYWAGKGTTGIPIRGVYGPLISAISMEPAG